MLAQEWPVAPGNFQGKSSEFPHLAKTGPDMGHPRPWLRKRSYAGSAGKQWQKQKDLF
jgi:hypothetical protein